MSEIRKFGNIICIRYSSSNPDIKGGQSTNMSRLWVQYKSEWFLPAARFNGAQIQMLVNLCNNEDQLDLVFKMLQSN